MAVPMVLQEVLEAEAEARQRQVQEVLVLLDKDFLVVVVSHEKAEVVAEQMLLAVKHHRVLAERVVLVNLLPLQVRQLRELAVVEVEMITTLRAVLAEQVGVGTVEELLERML